jgi:hypothetical protein
VSLCRLARQREERNVFTDPPYAIPVPISVGRILADGGSYICFKTNDGILRAKMTSKGNAVLVSSP